MAKYSYFMGTGTNTACRLDYLKTVDVKYILNLTLSSENSQKNCNQDARALTLSKLLQLPSQLHTSYVHNKKQATKCQSAND